MKKFIFLVALVTFLWNNLEAQTVNFGVKAGTNNARVVGVDAYELVSESKVSFSDIFSFHAGVFAVIPITEKFALQPEVLYSEQGFNYPVSMLVNNQSVTYDLDVKLNYINIPLIVKYYPFEQFSIDFGPQIGFLSDAKRESLSGSSVVKSDVKKDYEKTDTGFNFGIGYEGEKFIIYGRYTLGLKDLHKTIDADNKNSVLQFGAGYKFL